MSRAADQCQRLIEQTQGSKARVPASGVLVLGVNRERNASDDFSHGERTPARGQEQRAAQAVPLRGYGHGKPSEPEDRHWYRPRPRFAAAGMLAKSIAPGAMV